MLKPCLSCSRLVRGVETVCPFCGRAILSSSVPVFGRRRMTRAASMAAVAAIGVACGGATEPASDAGSADSAVKDSSAKDAAADAPADAGFQDVISVPPYGVPPGDGGK